MIRLILRIVGGLVAVLLIGCLGFYSCVALTWKKSFPDCPAPPVAATADSATIARGDYLVHAVAHCPAYHQSVDAYPTMREALEHRGSAVGRDLVGALTWEIPLFGRFVAANLTSDREAGVGAMSDPQLARVLRHGVRRDGIVAPLMSLATGPMSDEDLTAVVSYLRTLEPVHHPNRFEAPGILGKLVLKGMKPRSADSAPRVTLAGLGVERGSYLCERAGACFSCHSTATRCAVSRFGVRDSKGTLMLSRT